jgi:hypothetical protein
MRCARMLCRAGWLDWTIIVVQVAACGQVQGCVSVRAPAARLESTGPRLRSLPLSSLSTKTRALRVRRRSSCRRRRRQCLCFHEDLFRPYTREMRPDRESGRSRFFASFFFRPASTYILRLMDQADWRATTNSLLSPALRIETSQGSRPDISSSESVPLVPETAPATTRWPRYQRVGGGQYAEWS